MARYTGPREKIERRIGTKLFLKGERSYSPKSAMTRRPYPPGMHGKNLASRRRLSEFGLQLQAKQKVRNIYRLMEKQFKSLIKNAMKSKEESGNKIVQTLESRLDNVVFRAGFAQSRDQARQLVNHGHFVVNGRKVDIPSFSVNRSNVINIREGSKKMPYFSSLMPQWINKHEHPRWMQVDKTDMTVKITGSPTIEESGLEGKDLKTIVEYYSR